MWIKKFLDPDLYRMLQELRYHSDKAAYKKELEANERFRNIHSGKRCFILGNGPSLNNLDFSLLKDEFTLTVNQLPRNPKFADLHTNYHFWGDRLFFEISEDRPETMELLDVMRSVASPDNKPVVFYEMTARPMIEKFNLKSELDIAYFKTANLDPKIMLKKKIDFTNVIPGFATIVHYAICMAVYMGFSQIYLLGCDCTGFMAIAKNKLALSQEIEYGYEISCNERKRMANASRERSIRDELSFYVNLFDTYELLYAHCEQNKVELYNATEGGLLENLPHAVFEDLMK